MSDWLTIRVVLEGTVDAPLDDPPGRVFLAHADHTFADLAEAIDIAFGRWDLDPAAQFEIDGRTVVLDGDEGADEGGDLTLGEAAPRAGERFSYTFDPDEQWDHTCMVEAVDVDPIEEYGEEPDGPVPVFGWGAIPDQYWRETEDDESADEDSEGDGSDEEAWSPAEALDVVRQAVSDEPPYDVDREALRKVAAALRNADEDAGWPYGVLLAAAGLESTDLPDDDEALWVEVAAGVVSPADDLPVTEADASVWGSVEPADWAALAIEFTRADHDTRIDAAGMLAMIQECPEVEGEPLSPEEQHTLLRGLDIVRRMLETLGALDASGGLTPLGRWGVPRAVERGLGAA